MIMDLSISPLQFYQLLLYEYKLNFSKYLTGELLFYIII